MFRGNYWARLQNTLSPAIVLLLLVWITPLAAEPISYNDPFRAIALRVSRPPGPPICCLKPLPPLEPVEDDLLLSFEEWKARQQQSAEDVSPGTSSGSEAGNRTGNGSEPLKADNATLTSPAAQEDHQPHAPSQGQETTFQLPPHFRVPLVDRFNYASLDCSARVHKAHKGAKHSADILSSKKDRYMLSPCKTKEQQYVIIELCEDIRIDTVQLANFEFFSGVFKDITISVAKTSSEEEQWMVAGIWKAKNVRGVQSFHPPTSLRGFYRYLRIDFHSHYGSEYYCPVSLVRVYGLTHLEEWKWELWEAESKTKPEATLQDTQMYPTTETVNKNDPISESGAVSDTTRTVDEQNTMPSTSILPINETGMDVGPSSTTLIETPSHSTDTYLTSPLAITQPPELEFSHPFSLSISTISTSSSSSSTSISSVPSSTAPPKNATPASVSENDMNTTTVTTTFSSIVASPPPNRASPPSIILTPTPIAASQPFLPMPISGGESIFRTIMNRLVGLERNHTLYEQYMAQQQLVVRDALKRLGEDIGRLEGMGKAQRQAHDRTVLEWEKQRKQWQMEHAQLLQRIDYLSDEIIMEKRLGVAQLCLLLAVLVFMGLTRGSRGPMIEDRRHWKTTLKSLSGDWRLPGGRESKNPRALKRDGDQVEFPKSAPLAVPIQTADSGSAASSGENDAIASAPLRYALTDLELNTSPHRDQQQVRRRDGRENYRPENVHNVYMQHNGSGSFSHTRSRTVSRSRSRTSSWTGKGIFVHPGLAPNSRQATEMRGGYAASVTNTPSKALRVAGVYGPRPTFPSVRTSVYVPHPRRMNPLQRSQSSQGPPGSLDYVLGQTWAGSGSAPKSARRWARTAHLHEVKGKRREDESDSLNGDSTTGVGDDDGGGGDDADVFGGVGLSQTPKRSVRRRAKLSVPGSTDADADADADGWESASDVDVNSIGGI